LACGDGFNAINFYSLRSRRVVACDFDATAIKVAKTKNAAPNVDYILADIRMDMPQGSFQNVTWDGAIEHFTPTEIDQVLAEIKTRLTDDGILSGYTILECADGGKSLSHHEYEFKSKDDLLRFFVPHFRHATVFETIYPSRHNLYFWASDAAIPFSAEWRSAVVYGPLEKSLEKTQG
jgi:ubiquinone/menaquinone biosynthesis C-methylase UbiE